MNDEEVSKEFLGVKLPTFIPEASFGNIMHTPIASFDRNGEGNLNVLCALGIKDVFFKDFKNAPISNLQKVPQNFRYIFSPRDLFHGFVRYSLYRYYFCIMLFMYMYVFSWIVID